VTPDFADFYRDAKDDCLRTVVISTGDRELAQDLVAEAFARACASWRKVARHPNPRAWVVRTALNVHTDRWRHPSVSGGDGTSSARARCQVAMFRATSNPGRAF
jgi:DNA-directed RNA polymerase specialized sigma24 family protein